MSKTTKGAPVQGFIKKQNNKVILIMTIRRAFADIFWFTLFHEIAHFINGDSKQKFLDFESVENSRESKADTFAQNILIDKNAYQNFIKSKDFSLNSINAFANKQKILPSIIIGRLQKDKYLKWSDYSDQIKKYEIM